MARILVIDDEQAILEMFDMMLSNEGYDVVTADNGEVGLELFCQDPFDLIITDILMPHQDGFATIRKIKEVCPNVKIIAISGGGMMEAQAYLKTAIYAGAYRVFKKPVWRAELLGAIKDVLSQEQRLIHQV